VPGEEEAAAAVRKGSVEAKAPSLTPPLSLPPLDVLSIWACKISCMGVQSLLNCRKSAMGFRPEKHVIPFLYTYTLGQVQGI